MKKNSRVFFPTIVLVLLCLFLFSCYENAADIPGNDRKFNPVTSYEKVHAFAGKDTRLISIYANLVKSDGTLDIKADYKPTVTYKFYRPIHKEEIKKGGPLGSGIKEQRNVYTAEEVTVTISYPHHYTLTINNGEPQSKYDPGMNRTRYFNNKEYESLIAGPPGYTFEYVWEEAIRREVPADAVAVIYYDHTGYQFSIRDTSISYKIDIYGQLTEDE
ncbi:MAG: hypothetical protein JXJ04_09495 [Spirochaetales bacterium]|nr:hypothetical protein [Spirochaetales bacterium]